MSRLDDQRRQSRLGAEVEHQATHKGGIGLRAPNLEALRGYWFTQCRSGPCVATPPRPAQNPADRQQHPRDLSITARAFGVARSVAMYYGIPLRARRLRRFYSQFVTRGSLCFDVGAHAGNRVRCWRQLGAQVVAIEPQPDFVRLLTWLYGRDRHVAIVPVALGRAPGDAEIYVSERTPTVTTLSRDWVEGVSRDPRFAGVAWSPGQRVELADDRAADRTLRRARVREDRRRRLRGRSAGRPRDARARAVVRVPAGRARRGARVHRSTRRSSAVTATTGRPARPTGSRNRIGSTPHACAHGLPNSRPTRLPATSTPCATRAPDFGRVPNRTVLPSPAPRRYDRRGSPRQRFNGGNMKRPAAALSFALLSCVFDRGRAVRTGSRHQ